MYREPAPGLAPAHRVPGGFRVQETHPVQCLVRVQAGWTALPAMLNDHQDRSRQTARAIATPGTRAGALSTGTIIIALPTMRVIPKTTFIRGQRGHCRGAAQGNNPFQTARKIYTPKNERNVV